MRYRVDAATGAAEAPIDQTIFVSVGVFGIVLGVGFVVAGLRGRQHWLATWGGTLVLASVAYVGVSLFGWP